MWFEIGPSESNGSNEAADTTANFKDTSSPWADCFQCMTQGDIASRDSFVSPDKTLNVG